MRKTKAFIKHSWAIAPLAVAALLAGCSTLHVRTDYAHSVNFSNYHTYSWMKVSAGNDLWAQRIRRDVNAELAAKGWTEVPSGAQTQVTAFGSTREQPTLETFYDSFGPGFGGWYWGGLWGPGYDGGFGYSQTEVVNTPIGTLVVDVFDSQSKHLIWRGVAQQVLSGNPENNKGKLAHAVDKMFRNFPPTARG
jgi:hypothetical protein